MKLDAKQIAAMEDKIRVLFINSLSGFKSANLVGTCDAKQNTNLAIVSSVVHLGANPPLMGMIMRPHSVPRGTLENILKLGFYTLNHVHSAIYEKAHQTSARYSPETSEFSEVGLSEQWEEGFAAPFVAESVIKLGLKFREKQHLEINGTELIIGEIVSIEMPDDIVASDGFVSLEQAGTVAVSSLDSYHQTQLLGYLSYAKPDKSLTRIKRTIRNNTNITSKKSALSIIDTRPIANNNSPICVLVAGASGGIGQAYCECLIAKYPDVHLIRMARNLDNLATLKNTTTDISLDISNDKSIETAMSLLPENVNIDWVFIATGWLHDNHTKPEKTYRHLEREHLLHAYSINTIGPALFIKQLLLKLRTPKAMKIGILSARVGSISDNRLGGWHAYRSSKAALNMLIKNYSIELKNSRKDITIVGLQPGTTDTPLSAPFQKGLSAEQLQTTTYTADQLIKVMNALEKEDSGKLFDFEGLPFEP